jgi:hypothetical protein
MRLQITSSFARALFNAEEGRAASPDGPFIASSLHAERGSSPAQRKNVNFVSSREGDIGFFAGGVTTSDTGPMRTPQIRTPRPHRPMPHHRPHTCAQQLHMDVAHDTRTPITGSSSSSSSSEEPPPPRPPPSPRLAAMAAAISSSWRASNRAAASRAMASSSAWSCLA